MSITKHKVFKLQLSNSSKQTITKLSEKTINEFLLDSNIVYLNHSITTLTEDVEEYGNVKTVCRFILISIVYKDLNSSFLDTKSTTEKVKKVVHKQVVLGEEIAEPKTKTEIDKTVESFNIKPSP